MDAIEQAAFISIGRACGFAGFGILVLLLSLSFDPALATRTAGAFALLVAGAAYVYGLRAPNRPYQKTEAWIILADDYRPPHAVAQKLMGNALRDTAFSFARKVMVCASLLLGASVVFKYA